MDSEMEAMVKMKVRVAANEALSTLLGAFD